ncbi:MAG: ACT domain-containing protein [Actinomycetota bacterium]
MTDPIVRLREELAALDRAYSPGHHGLWSARRRAEILDTALTGLFAVADSPPGMALAAVGGFGRREQLPGSDVDLLLAHDGAHVSEVAAFAERFLVPLWDAGFTLGHAVRTPAEAKEAAADHPDAATAMLDGRLLAGDPDVLDHLRAGVLADVAGDPAAFAGTLRTAAHERHERFGSAAHLLEPEVKEGAGGLRDVATIGWLELATGRALLLPGERSSLEAAHEFLTRVRSALHLETGRRTDRLVAEHQASIAAAMGFADEPRLPAVDGLMRALFEHARQVAYLTQSVFDRVGPAPAAGRSAQMRPLAAPAEILTMAALAAEDGRPLDADELGALSASPRPMAGAWSGDAREAFLRILRAGDAGVTALEALDRLDLLAAFLPEWAQVRCRPQRDPYHRFTVDVHLLDALARMGRMLAGDVPAEDPVAAEAARQIEDHDGLLLGALLHDIGKNGEGGHVAVGERLAADALERMGVEDPTRDLVSFMVGRHLLLPDTATRRDLTDDDLILDVAATIGTPERLAALYLLVVADAGATGPAAWTPWRRTLVRELVAKVQRVFDRGDMGAELADRLTDRIDRLRDLLIDEPSREVERHVLRLPRSYFLSVEPAQAAKHFSLIAPEVGAHEVRSAAVEGARPGAYGLLVVAMDRPGLLSWIAGSLSLAGLSIRTAQAFTTDDEVAVDLFEVEGAFEPQIHEGRWREFRSVLRKVLEGRISLDHRVDDKRRHYPPPRRPSPVTVKVDQQASDFFTIIEVGAPDRIGLLYDITRTLADLHLDVHLAKVTTYTDRVIDTFYVRDELGRKVDRSGESEIEAAFRARLGT